ncbi:ABC transporter substrate-binding protein [Enhydrobacter sp.]|jgi:peptide/nickel transport system substrate-binding protein|uniref:ABC transporter substrate-binding protein n=1 Tax=Enhydrobacter sp. TaxID=1894999 RepID=UPI0026366F3C|nr:ABC transporter substrate-binding protein [Enhydrobacter sp.]WIM10399.1 MAG: ABC transporter, substrate-binding protein (cluster 5, nickel/peptides/opines) [Enhydrobacter sp.]
MRRLVRLAAIVFAVFGVAAAQAQDTPRRGGTIRMTAPYAASFGSLDPHATPRAQDDIVGKALQRSLYSWDTANNKPVLELAKSVSASPDGLTYTYKLRDDAYFHNGRKMTADDVIWSYNRIMDGSKGFPGARYVRIIKGAVEVEKGQAKEISGLKKIDDFTLEMTLTERVEPGYYFFAGTTAILPREEVERGNYGAYPVGLGPFKFKEHIPGSRVAAERWDKFYKPGKPYADKLEVLIMAEAAARDVAFRNKEIDTSILGPAQYVAYRADPELSKGILEVAEMFTRAMQFNPTYKPFADKRVRQAINYAIDTNLIIKRLVKDKAYRAVSWLPPSSAAFDKTMQPYPFDPAKAKKLLADAGYPNGFEFELSTSQNESWGLPIVEAIIPYLDKVGIKLKPKLVEVTVLTEIAMKGEHQAFIGSNLTGPDSLATLRCFYSKTPRTACNYTSFNNPEFDKLLDAAGEAADMAKRNDLLRQANNLLYEEAPVWFFNYNKAVLAYQPWIHGLQANPTEITHQYPENIWVDATSPAK